MRRGGRKKDGQQWLTQRCSPSMDNWGPYHACHLPYLIDQGAGLPSSSHRKREGRGAVGLLRHGSSFRRAHSSLNAIDCPQGVSAYCPFISSLSSPLFPLPPDFLGLNPTWLRSPPPSLLQRARRGRSIQLSQQVRSNISPHGLLISNRI